MGDPIDPGGPLPQVDGYSKNQHRSLKRLNAALVDDLRFRYERIDGTIEVYVSGRDLEQQNLRVQLKSQVRDARNHVGSLSYVPNLVYLLSGRSPVVYVIDTDSLLYAGVRDEIKRIESDWKRQGVSAPRVDAVGGVRVGRP